MAADPRKGTGANAYLRLRKQLKHRTMKTNAVCAHCGQPFDWTLPPQHPMAFTADHVDAIANGGDLLGELQALHRPGDATARRAVTSPQSSAAHPDPWGRTPIRAN